MNPLLHYVRHGIREGRNPDPHTLDENVEKLSDIIRKSDLFDSSWYLEQYPSIAKEITDPVLDYLCKGYRDGRDPGPEFDTGFYLTEYQDVADSGTNPWCITCFMEKMRDVCRKPAGRTSWSTSFGADFPGTGLRNWNR